MGLGDELMAAGEAQKLSKDFDNCRVAILDKSKKKVRWHELWRNNPHIAKPGKKFTKSIVNCHGRRGYIKSFEADKWTWQAYRPIPAEMFFSDDEKKFADSIGQGFVVLGPGLLDKVESVNRDWGWDNFIALINTFPNIDWVQLGPKGTKTLPKVRLIITPSARMAVAALTKANGFVSHEGGTHHMAAAVGLKGVVIYGGFTSEHVSGYTMHRHISVGPGLGCGSRIKCNHCAEAMKSITIDRVASELIKCLEE
jgi:ADP-heptose:LPS heptosyltransferase